MTTTRTTWKRSEVCVQLDQDQDRPTETDTFAHITFVDNDKNIGTFLCFSDVSRCQLVHCPILFTTTSYCY